MSSATCKVHSYHSIHQQQYTLHTCSTTQCTTVQKSALTPHDAIIPVCKLSNRSDLMIYLYHE